MLDNDEKIIAVDIDGTICSPEPDYTRCSPLPGARDALSELRERGYKIYLHTGRHILNYGLTVAWLDHHRIPFDHIVFGKPPAKYYIDDRAIKFNSWSEVLNEMDSK